MRPRVKICGVTRLEDAEAAVGFGADAIGFVFWPESPRVVPERVARAIAQKLPDGVASVGVFVNAPPEEVARIVREVGLTCVQLHGDEVVDDYARVGARVIKAVTTLAPAVGVSARDLPESITVLVDADDPVRRGGTGRSANWIDAAALATHRPIVLAGGLSAENIGEAIAAVHPWAVDVSSGVESAPGIKSVSRLEALFAALNVTAADRPSFWPQKEER